MINLDTEFEAPPLRTLIAFWSVVAFAALCMLAVVAASIGFFLHMKGWV